MDALTLEKDFLCSFVCPTICFEIGCGSGAVSAHVATLLGPNVAYFCTDINPDAAALTLRTAQHNRVLLNVVLASFASSLLPRLENRIDVLIFNPPYVPTSPRELCGRGIERSWAGGPRGRHVLDQLLPSLSALLSERGAFYLVTVDENEPAEIHSILAQQGFVHTVRSLV